MQLHIAASAETLYDLVSDVGRMGQWSPECRRCAWLDGADGPAAGARFTGTNRRGLIRWTTQARVRTAERGREFSFVKQGADETTWTYRFRPDASGTTVIETFELGRDLPRHLCLIERWLLGIRDRKADLERGMVRTLERLKASAERLSDEPAATAAGQRIDRRRRSRTHLPVTTVLLVIWALLVAPAAPSQAIIGGEADTTHPNVGQVRTGLPGAIFAERGWCTGTLIADRVVLTAAHCMAGPDGPMPEILVSFNPTWQPDPVDDPSAADEYLSGTGYLHPRFARGPMPGASAHDMAVVVLDGSAKAKWGIDPAPLPPAGFLDRAVEELKRYPFTAVGYGVGEYLGGRRWEFNAERQVTTMRLKNVSDRVSFYALNPNDSNGGGGGCFGDSGGPVFAGDLPYVLGDYVRVSSLKCNGTGWYTRTDTPAAREFLGQFVPLP